MVVNTSRIKVLRDEKTKMTEKGGKKSNPPISKSKKCGTEKTQKAGTNSGTRKISEEKKVYNNINNNNKGKTRTSTDNHIEFDKKKSRNRKTKQELTNTEKTVINSEGNSKIFEVVETSKSKNLLHHPKHRKKKTEDKDQERERSFLEKTSQIEDKQILSSWIRYIYSLPKYAKYYSKKQVAIKVSNYYQVLAEENKMPKSKNRTSPKRKTGAKKNKSHITTYTTMEDIGRECSENMSNHKADLIMNPIDLTKGVSKTLNDISEEDEEVYSKDNESVQSTNSETETSDNESENANESMEESDEEDSEDDEYDLNAITKDYANTYLLPVTDKPPSMQELVKMVQGTNPSDMTIVGEQKITKERLAVFEEHSKRLAPHHLPATESTNYDLKPTKYVLPLTLKMKSPKYGNYKFNNSRALVALLKAMQIVSPEIYIAPVLENSEEKILVNPLQIPTEENELKNYMMAPMITRTRVFITKIIVKSNVDLKEIKTNTDFLYYVGEHGIQIDYNRLETVIPYNVGILENVIPRHDTLLLHYERINKLLPLSAPLFMVSLHKTFGKDGKWLLTVMIKAEKDNVNKLSEMLLELNKQGKIGFFPWHDYSCMNSGKKLTQLNIWRKWSLTLYSLLITDFKDDEDNIPMHVTEKLSNDVSKKTYKESTSVSNYIRNNIKSVTGKNLFAYVYPPINGVREVLVKWENFSDATRWIASAHGELAREMNGKAIRRVFKDPEQAINASKLKKWEVFTRAHEIEETEVKKQDTENYTKRIRHTTEQDHYPKNRGSTTKISYKSALTSETPDQVEINEPIQQSEEITLLKTQVVSLTHKMSNLQKEIQATITNITNEAMVGVHEKIEINNIQLKKDLSTELKSDIKIEVEKGNASLADMIRDLQKDIKESKLDSRNLVEEISDYMTYKLEKNNKLSTSGSFMEEEYSFEQNGENIPPTPIAKSKEEHHFNHDNRFEDNSIESHRMEN
jgi:hypothetical protein